MAKKMIFDNIRLINSILIVLMVNVLMGCISDIFSTKPKAIFEYHPSKNIKTGDTIRFTNNSKNADLYYWDFDDSCSSNEKQPIHAFKNKRIYSVKLYASKRYVTDGNFEQDTDTLTKLIDVSIGAPIACFDYKRSSPNTLVFTNCSFQAADYLWDFGDGTTSIDKEPTHLYNSYGSYIVTLTTTNDGISDSVSKVIEVTDEISLNNISCGNWYLLDVDFDGVADFRFETYSFFGTSSSYSYSRIKALNNYEVLTDTASTRVTNIINEPKFSTYLSTIPKIYVLGNTIQSPYTTNNGTINFYSEGSEFWVGRSYICDIWKKDETRYVAFRKIYGNTTKIGWIKLKVLDFTILQGYKIPMIAETLTIK